MKKYSAIFVIVAILCFGSYACSKSNAEADKKTEETVTFSLEPLVVNVAGTADMKYMKMSLSLELAGANLAEKAKLKTPQLRDAIITIATTKTPEELSNAEGKMQFKEEVLQKCNQILDKGSVRNLYFTEFVLQ